MSTFEGSSSSLELLCALWAKLTSNFKMRLSTGTITNQISVTEGIPGDLQWASHHLGLMSVFYSFLISNSYLGDLNNSH